MLITTKALEGYAIGAVDGPFGRVTDFYFDDSVWVVRSVAVAVDSKLPRYRVLIPVVAAGMPESTTRTLPVFMTTRQVCRSPSIDSVKPDLHLGEKLCCTCMSESEDSCEHAGNAECTCGLAASACGAARGDVHQIDNARLRSCGEVMSYDVRASDGGIGPLRGFILEAETWAIRYLIVETAQWLPRRPLLIAPYWIDDVQWNDGSIPVDLCRQAVEDAAPYNAAASLDRQREVGFYRWNEAFGFPPVGRHHSPDQATP